MKKISIRERLILYFVVVSIISIATVSLFSIFEAKKGIINRTFSQLILLRDLRREQILTFFESRSNELKSLAASDDINEMACFTDERDDRDSPFAHIMRDRHLLELVTDTAYCKSLYFISARDNLYRYISANKDHAFLPDKALITLDSSLVSSFKDDGSKNDPVIFEQTAADGSLQIFIAAPVFNNGNYKGALLSEILPDAVFSILYNKNPGTGLGQTGEAYLVGPDGLMRSPSRFVPEAVLNVPVKTSGFFEAAGGKEGMAIYNDYRGIKVLGAYCRIEYGGMRRIILAEIDSDEALVPLKAIRNEILLLSLIILLAIFAAAWFVAFGIIRPLVRLKNAANFIALGNYNQQLEVNVNDEIGELTRAFNLMAREIQSTTQNLRENEERLQHYYRATIDGQDIERQRLSRELHDGLGQQLVAGKLILESSLYGDDMDLKPKIAEAQRIFDQIIADIRRISHDLSPSILQEFGLKVAVENLCNNIIITTGIRLDFFIDLADQDPDEMTSTYLFRIAQEGLNNVQRHSGATSVSLVLKAERHGILLEIEDNGCGFQVREVSKRGGNGLYNMRERVNILKGNLSIKTSPGHGTKLLVRVPFSS